MLPPLELLPNTLGICRLPPDAHIPNWIYGTPFYSITKTPDELSIVCDEHLIPADVKAEKGWRCFKVKGPLDFSLTGILASIANPLAKAGISIFAISTFDTDYILVKSENLDAAKKLLKLNY